MADRLQSCDLEQRSSLLMLQRCLSVSGADRLSESVDEKTKASMMRHRTNTDEDSGTEEVEPFIGNSSDVYEEQLNGSLRQLNIDEGFSEGENEETCHVPDRVLEDLTLAKGISSEEKKDFCPSTMEAFHGEFARLISIPLFLRHRIGFYLFAEEELLGEHSLDVSTSTCMKLDNAKGQFKCPNPACQHAWTSMRARISFTFYGTNPVFVLVKIFEQDCELCQTTVNAVWYIDEVCRVMRNLAEFLFETSFPSMVDTLEQSVKSEETQVVSRHDPHQRKGKMRRRHNQQSCEACRRGLCFI